MRYILITEFQDVFKSDTLSDEDKDASINGILDIIDTQDMKRYIDGNWEEIEVWGE